MQDDIVSTLQVEGDLISSLMFCSAIVQQSTACALPVPRATRNTYNDIYIN